MGKIPELLKNNDHYLKTCILYEAGQKKSIFDSYRTFCDVVGQGVMEYQDFEFWYCRFSQGELDFDYDRSMDTALPKTLMDMPVKLMRKITDELNIFERSHLRSMNHALKDAIDSFPTVFKSIWITAYENKLSWKLNQREFECNPEENGSTFSRPKCLNTENESYSDRKKNTVTKKCEESYLKKGLEYLTPLFKIPNLQTNHLWFVSTIQTPELDDLLPVPFYTKSAYIHVSNFDKMVQLLSTLKAGNLEGFKISFDAPIGKEQLIARVFETDQFKQAQVVQIHCIVEFNVEDLMNFSHLKQFSCGLNTINAREILRIREIVSSFKDFEECEILYRRNGRSIRPVVEALGEDTPEGPVNRITHRYQIPKSDKTLEMTISGAGGEWLSIEIVKV
ncbi:hypothetical protein B9Z55_026956 [Caenorhabditis nigoni]|uniref:F-box domain-containing protein n=1 Tax=Caenorhabditis nigoni TaxID=1611254 RepID=A0A2G5SI30_9PELO|nr:hypothetical protein B9Z55_026956 [Caenorhabditis nigoni]